MTETQYFKTTVEIFGKFENGGPKKKFDALNFTSYMDRLVGAMIYESNKKHENLPQGILTLEGGEMSTSLKDKCPRGRFKK